jgi:hypothetical protein
MAIVLIHGGELIMTKKILEGIELPLKDGELEKILNKFDLPNLEEQVEAALKSSEQEFVLGVSEILRRLYVEIGNLAKKKGIKF